MASRLLHNLFDIVASLANNMRVIRIRHVHLQCHSVDLYMVRMYIKSVEFLHLQLDRKKNYTQSYFIKKLHLMSKIT